MRARHRFALITVAAAALLWPVTSVLGAASSPGPVPPDCGDDPTIQAAGGEPVAGLAGPAPAGCLIQSWAATFSLSPHVLHVRDEVTAKVTTSGKLPGTGWSWSNFTAEMQAGLEHRRHCEDNAPTCTVRVGPDVPEGRYQVYVEGLATPLGGAVSSDYFVVDNNLFELSGKVEHQNEGTRTPASGVRVQVSGRNGRRDVSTGANGAYSFVLDKGSYHVTVVGEEAQPSSRDVMLDSNVDGVDFLTGCVGRPTFQVVHVKHGDTTTIGYEGGSWDVAGCGPVTVTVSGERGPISELGSTYDSDHFKSVFNVKGRICGADFAAQQQRSGRILKASFSKGHSTPARVVFADPTLDSDGEDLFPGDVLCAQDVGSQLAAIDSGGPVDVSEIAQRLGLRLLEIGTPGGMFLADAAGKVHVAGQSAQHSSEAASILAGAAASGNPSKLPATAAGDTTVSGFAQSPGPYTVSGNLTLSSGVLLIHGDLTVSGTITGTGAVIVTGNITAAGVTLESDDQYGLIAGGRFNLP